MKLEKQWKLVCQNPNNDDQDLFGLYTSQVNAEYERPRVFEKYRRIIENYDRLMVKRVDPEMICNPVCTDYMHYVWALIPKEEIERVMKSDASAEIHANCHMCGGETYYYLSRLIPKDWTVIDIGCAYNSQSYLFQDHKRHIAIEPVWHGDDWHFEYFKAPNTEMLFMTGQEFIQDELPKMDLDLDKTFCIVNFVPSGAANLMARETFKNIYTFYPKS